MKWLAPLALCLALAGAPPALAQYAFQPFGIGTASVTATTSSAATALTLPSPVPRRTQIRVYNSGAATVFILFGTSGTVSTTGNLPVPAGAVEILSVPEGTTHVATITSAGTALVYFTAGQGL
jgi:hypothetical protein